MSTAWVGSQVRLKTSWHDLLGENGHTFTAPERRSRWERWKTLARQAGEHEMLEYWSSGEGCEGCRHLDGDWCTNMELPCSINPILTMRHGMIGMACAGAGYEPNSSHQAACRN